MPSATMHNETVQADWLEGFLHDRIPLADAMQLRVLRLDDDGIEMHAPLAPNVNDKGTAFGGSILSLMTLAGWSLLQVMMEREKIRAEVVIAGCQARFITPLTSSLIVRCAWPDEAAMAEFWHRFRARNRARLQLFPHLQSSAAGPAATMDADFAALLRE